jgi:glycine dehydrogenase subunit 1
MPEAEGAADPDRVAIAADVAAVVVQHPNVWGRLEPGAAIAAKAKAAGALTIAVCNPVSLGLLAPPGRWGAEIAVGDVQPVGVPVSFGGPYAGFMAARKDLVRRMPGRIVGQTVDVRGRRGFVLTLQAREQHIRREKATSNICTNQALVALMFTVAASLIGGGGLRRLAQSCAARTQSAIRRLGRVPGVKRLHAGPVFHEFVLDLPAPADAVARDCVERHGIVPGVPVSRLVPGRTRELLVCVTESKSAADLDALAEALVDSLSRVAPREAVAR